MKSTREAQKLWKIKITDFELKMKCSNERKSDSLQGFKVIGISTGIDKGKQIMTIDLIVNLWNETLKKDSDFFTIGTLNVPNIDLNTGSANVNYKNKFTGNAQSLHWFLNKNNENLHAIAIIYKKGYSFSDLTLSSKKTSISINSDIQELIKSNLVDFKIYGTKAPYDNCKIFTKYNDYANKE